ncbi:MAG: hypothetical protein HWD83_00655 [Gammaproteobacteria bacterium]|nr:hypothetical protein [Gammaproteobacteria bacterium]
MKWAIKKRESRVGHALDGVMLREVLEYLRMDLGEVAQLRFEQALVAQRTG